LLAMKPAIRPKMIHPIIDMRRLLSAQACRSTWYGERGSLVRQRSRRLGRGMWTIRAEMSVAR
jgi:hypothetical protein